MSNSITIPNNPATAAQAEMKERRRLLSQVLKVLVDQHIRDSFRIEVHKLLETDEGTDELASIIGHSSVWVKKEAPVYFRAMDVETLEE